MINEHDNRNEEITNLASNIEEEQSSDDNSSEKHRCPHDLHHTEDHIKQTNENEEGEAIFDALKLLEEVKDIEGERHMLKVVVAV